MIRPCSHPCPRCARSDRETQAMRELVRSVALFFGLSHAHILDRTRRDRDTVAARHLAVWVLTEHFPNATYDRIADLTGYRERSGPSHAIAYLERRMPHDEHLRLRVNSLREAVAA